MPSSRDVSVSRPSVTRSPKASSSYTDLLLPRPSAAGGGPKRQHGRWAAGVLLAVLLAAGLLFMLSWDMVEIPGPTSAAVPTSISSSRMNSPKAAKAHAAGAAANQAPVRPPAAAAAARPGQTTGSATAGAGSVKEPRICRGTQGNWCHQWHLQRVPPVPLVPYVPASRPCPNNCSGIGNCNADIGVCYCPAAWGGADCSQPVRRACTDRLGGLREQGTPFSHIGPDKLDLNLSAPGFQYGRCAGVCDDEYGRCYCRGPGKYGRVPAPPGSAPGAPAINRGRPTHFPCSHPATGPDGNKLSWGAGPAWEELYGPGGWCVADKPQGTACGCQYDGWDGPGCSTPTEQTCLNQCSGRGVCQNMGFCKCPEGWYGVDCAYPSSAADRPAGATPAKAQPAATVATAAQPAAVAADETASLWWIHQTAVDAWSCYSQHRDCLEDLAAAEWPQQSVPAGAAPASGAAAAQDAGGSSTQAPPAAVAPSRAVLSLPESSSPQFGRSSQQPAAEAGPLSSRGSGSTGSGSTTASTSSSAGSASWLSTPRASHAMHRRWLQLEPAARGPAAVQSSAAGRARPLIYIYNIPDSVVSHLLQYRSSKHACVWRAFQADNSTTLLSETYGLEVLFLDMMLGSSHRTLNPEEADFFYVPVLAACWMTYQQGEFDWPWFTHDSWSRVKAGVVMYQRALDFVKTAYPFWNASQGADHIWLFTHDEGACWAPAEVYANSIVLTHWGRNTPDNFPAHTNYGQDNYTVDILADPALPKGMHAVIGHHRCYTPGKDIVVPPVKHPSTYVSSPYLGAPARRRDILGFHRGRVLENQPQFSLGVRQNMVAAARRGNWSSRYRIQVEEHQPGAYSELLARSVFCFVLQGDGWTARFSDAITHGCIPVVVMDAAEPPFAAELDWDQILIRIPVKDLERIPQILQGTSIKQIEVMQAAIERVWHRMVWLGHPLMVQQLGNHLRDNQRLMQQQQQQQHSHHQQQQQQQTKPWHVNVRPVSMEHLRNDAFQTMIQILHSRLKKTL